MPLTLAGAGAAVSPPAGAALVSAGNGAAIGASSPGFWPGAPLVDTPSTRASAVGAAVVAASVAASVAYSWAKPIWGRGSGQEEGGKKVFKTEKFQTEN